jgi:hypothetical protein
VCDVGCHVATDSICVARHSLIEGCSCCSAQSRQKAILIKEEGSYVLQLESLCISRPSIRGTRRFQVRGKLAPQYIGPYRVLQRIGLIAYRIWLPEEMSNIHNVFHVSQLKKCLRVPEEQISPDTIDLQDDLRYQEVPIKILDTVTKQTRTTTVQICHV